MNGLAALSDTKRVDKTTKSKVGVVPSKSPMQVPTVGEASVAMETTQKTIVKDIKEPRARVAKSGIKQVGLKAKSEVSSVDPVPDPHAIATVIAASVAASTVKQGKNDEQLANCSSPRNVDKAAVLSGSMMGHMGEREKVEMEKQTYSRGKSRTVSCHIVVYLLDCFCVVLAFLFVVCLFVCLSVYVLFVGLLFLFLHFSLCCCVD